MALCHLLTLKEGKEDEECFSRQAPPSVSLSSFLLFPFDSTDFEHQWLLIGGQKKLKNLHQQGNQQS